MTVHGVTEVVAVRFGEPADALQTITSERRAPGRGEVEIAVRAIGVNHVDYKRYSDPDYTKGHGETTPDFPMPLGVEASGKVIAVGEDANGPAGPIVVGDEVIAYRIRGAYADELVVPADAVVPKPAEQSWEEAGVMMLDGTTAAHTLAAVRARRGETVLVHAAGGGVGLCVAQLVALEGIKVIGTAADRDFETLRGYGSEPVAYGDGLEDRVRKAAPHGIDAAIDLIGTDEAVAVSLALVEDRSRIATIVAFERARAEGFQALGGAPGQNKVGVLIREAARLRLTALVQAGAFTVNVARMFPLCEAVSAHQLLAKGGVGGRIVLVPDEVVGNR